MIKFYTHVDLKALGNDFAPGDYVVIPKNIHDKLINCAILSAVRSLNADDMIPLDPEFSKTLDENLWDLLEE